MHYFIYADKDATIYSGSLVDESVGRKNTGLDEILELDKRVSPYVQGITGTTDSVSRVLLQFDLTEISRSISAETIPDTDFSQLKFYLNLYVVSSSGVPLEYTVCAYPVSQSWTMGVGRKYDYPITEDGATWHWTDSSGSTEWDSAGGSWKRYASGSGVDLEKSQSFSYETADVRLDVTAIVKHWIDGFQYMTDGYVGGSPDSASYTEYESIPNYGFLLKRTASVESDSSGYGLLQFFSRDTHTIYPPKLEVCWDDSSWSTGSLSAVDTTGSEYLLYMKELRSEYKETSKTRFKVVGRERYPTKTFATSSDYDGVKYLPSGTTYYSVKDVHTNETLVPFDTYTKVSCNSDGNYFDLWMAGLQPERYYKFVFKVEEHGLVDYHDNDFIFKVVR